MTIDDLSRALGSDDEETRYQGLKAAGALAADAPVVDLYLRALGDESWRVRKGAVERLIEASSDAAVVERLVSALADEENAGTRNAAAEALVRVGSGATKALCARLSDQDQDLRKFAVDILGEIGDTAAVPALLARIHDPDENVRGAAAEALGKIGGGEAEQALVGALAAGDLLVTLSALDALARAGSLVPLATLEPLLGQRLLRRPALRLLARIEDEAALAALVDGLADPSRGTREAALGALSEWIDWFDPSRQHTAAALAGKDPAGIVELAELALAGRDPAVVAGAIEVLGILEAVELAPRLVEVAEDERHRERVTRALLVMGSDVTEPLLAALDRLAPSAQAVCVSVLAGIGDRRAVSLLVERLDHDEGPVRIAAVEALGQLGDARAVVPLARLLGRPDRSLAGAVVRSLAALAEPAREEVLDACRALLGNEDPLKVADACKVLGEMGTKAEVPLFKAVLHHEDARAREAAVDALGRLPGTEAEAELRFALADESPQVRASVARALGRQGGDAAAETLLIVLSDDDPSVVAAAAEALGALGRPENGGHLLPLVGAADEPGPAVQVFAAIHALGRLAAPELVVALSRAAAHPEGEVVKEVCAVAADLPGAPAARVLLTCARHPAWDVRRAAARALARRGDPGVLDDLRSLAASETDPLAAEGFEEAVARLEEI